MPSWFKSSKRSAADAGKASSLIAHSSFSPQQPPAREHNDYPKPAASHGYAGPTTTSHPSSYHNHSAARDRPTTSHIPTRYPSHRSVSPLGTSRFERPSPYTFTRRDRQQSGPRQASLSSRTPVVEVPQLGHDGYYGTALLALTPRTQPPRPQPRQQQQQHSVSRPHAIEVPNIGNDGYFGASDTTMSHQGAGVARRNAVRGRGGEGERMQEVSKW